MRAKDLFTINSIHSSNNYGLFKVINFRSSLNVKIKFLETGYELTTTAGALKKGIVKDKLSLTIFGVACLGDGKYNTTTGDTKTSIAIIYPRWSAILAKCYSENTATSYKAFGGKGVRVCNEWLNFQNFAEWIDKKVPQGSNFSLTLIDGAKLFSPENVTINITKAK